MRMLVVISPRRTPSRSRLVKITLWRLALAPQAPDDQHHRAHQGQRSRHEQDANDGFLKVAASCRAGRHRQHRAARSPDRAEKVRGPGGKASVDRKPVGDLRLQGAEREPRPTSPRTRRKMPCVMPSRCVDSPSRGTANRGMAMPTRRARRKSALPTRRSRCPCGAAALRLPSSLPQGERRGKGGGGGGGRGRRGGRERRGGGRGKGGGGGSGQSNPLCSGATTGRGREGGGGGGRGEGGRGEGKRGEGGGGGGERGRGGSLAPASLGEDRVRVLLGGNESRESGYAPRRD